MSVFWVIVRTSLLLAGLVFIVIPFMVLYLLFQGARAVARRTQRQLRPRRGIA